MTEISFREFKPTIFFLGKFLGLYIAGNLVYGLFVTAYDPLPDPATRWVSGMGPVLGIQTTASVNMSC